MSVRKCLTAFAGIQASVTGPALAWGYKMVLQELEPNPVQKAFISDIHTTPPPRMSGWAMHCSINVSAL